MQRLFYNEPLPNANHLDIGQVGWHGGRKSPVMPALLWESLGRGEKEEMAGAGGFEPPPSALTVQRPTNWTTPQASDYSTCVGTRSARGVAGSSTPGPAFARLKPGAASSGSQGIF